MRKIVSAVLLFAVLLLTGCGKHEAIQSNFAVAKMAANKADSNYRAIIAAQATDMRKLLTENYEVKHRAAVNAEIARGKASKEPDALQTAVENVQALERVKLQKYKEFSDYFASIQAKVDAAGKDTATILALMDNASEYFKLEQNKSDMLTGIATIGSDLILDYLESTKPAPKPAK